MLDFTHWAQKFLNDDAKELAAAKPYNASRCKKSAVFIGFRCSDDAALCEFGMQLISQMGQASVATTASASENGPIKKTVTFLLRDRMAPVPLANAGHFLQLLLEAIRRKTETTFVNR